MNHYDHMRLIQGAIEPKRQVWAELGSGDGAFTLALRQLAGDGVEIYSVDKDEARLAIQQKHFEEMLPQTNIHYMHQDFERPMDLPMLDGILMANSLHYVEKKIAFLLDVKQYLKPSGQILLVEYNSEAGNRWVPYPLSFRLFEALCKETGFLPAQKLATHPSDFLHEIYSATTHIR